MSTFINNDDGVTANATPEQAALKLRDLAAFIETRGFPMTAGNLREAATLIEAQAATINALTGAQEHLWKEIGARDKVLRDVPEPHEYMSKVNMNDLSYGWRGFVDAYRNWLRTVRHPNQERDND